jgi:hypothetical protein
MFAQECGSNTTVHFPSSHVRCVICWMLITQKARLIEGYSVLAFMLFRSNTPGLLLWGFLKGEVYATEVYI